MTDFLNEWIKVRNTLPFKSVLVFPRYEFQEVYNQLSPLDDVVFISIENTDGEEHIAASSERVLNINFDDVDEDGDGVRVITEEQGKEIYGFIEKNQGKHFIVHCTAGRSRSQGVARSIFDMYGDVYRENNFNRYNPCTSPNYAVVATIKRNFWNF